MVDGLLKLVANKARKINNLRYSTEDQTFSYISNNQVNFINATTPFPPRNVSCGIFVFISVTICAGKIQYLNEQVWNVFLSVCLISQTSCSIAMPNPDTETAILA